MVTRGVAGQECECRITHHWAIWFIRIAHGIITIQFLDNQWWIMPILGEIPYY